MMIVIQDDGKVEYYPIPDPNEPPVPTPEPPKQEPVEGIIWQYDMNTLPLYDGVSNRDYTHDWSLTQVQDPTGSANKVARFELRNTDDLPRTEVAWDTAAKPYRWYSFRGYFPSEHYGYDDVSEVIAQWHSVPDPGEDWRTPTISLQVLEDNWIVKVGYHTAPISPANPPFEGETVFNLGPIIKDAWVQFVWEIKHSYKADGFVRLWINDTQVINHSGPNEYNDVQLPYWKMGIYKWAWQGTGTTMVSKRVLYYDDVRIGGTGVTYSDMVPATTAPIPTPTKSIVSISQTNSYNSTTNILSVTWKLVFSKEYIGNVLVNHSRNSDGVPEDYTWGINPASTSWQGTYSYDISKMIGDTLSYTIRESSDYTLGTNNSTTIDISSYKYRQPTPPPEPEKQAPTPKPVPNKTSLTYEPYLVLTDNMFIPGETTYIRNRYFRNIDNLRGAISNLPNTNSPYTRNGGNKNWNLVIENCVIDSSGRGIDILYANINIIVRNCFFFSSGYCSKDWGSYALALENPKSVVFENNYCQGVGGLKVVANNDTLTGGVVHRLNKYVNLAAKTSATTKTNTNYFTLQGGSGHEYSNCISEYNLLTTDESNESGGLEDTVNISRFRGTKNSPVTVRYDCTFKTYPFPYNATDGWSGSGIMVESPNQPDKNKVCANVHIHNNYLIGMGRGSIKIFTANNTLSENNHIVFSRKHLDGSTRSMYTTGIGGANYYNYSGTTFNNIFANNYIKWAYGGGGGDPIDAWTPSTGINNDPTNPTWHNTPEMTGLNASSNNIDPNPATLQDEVNKYNDWKDLMKSLYLTVGPIES
jgi:hypothetical protein